MSFMPQVPSSRARVGTRTIDRVAAEILGASRSPVQVMLLDGANPVFGSPSTWRVRDALLKVPFIASVSSFLDETSVLADLILPDHSFLESWVDNRPESGATVAVETVAAPVMKPLHATRATPDVLLDVSRRLARPLAPPLAWQTFDEMLKAAVATLPSSDSPDERWAATQKQGGWWGPLPPAARRSEVKTSPGRRFEEPQFDGAAAEFPFHFLPYPSQAFLDGSLAHLPWLQELPDAIATAMWSSWIEINPQTAERLQIAEGDLVELTTAHGSLRAPALVSPGIAPDVIAMPVGQGHTAFTRYASGRGQNPVALLSPLVESETGSLAWAATRVRLTRVADGRGELILFAGEKEEHPHGHER
jgi:anaerobic selenocysteine-containing dehydrogenase